MCFSSSVCYIILLLLYIHTVDASYEGTQKRTFLIAALLAAAHLPFIVEVLAFFKQFGRSDDVDRDQGRSELKQKACCTSKGE